VVCYVRRICICGVVSVWSSNTVTPSLISGLRSINGILFGPSSSVGSQSSGGLGGGDINQFALDLGGSNLPTKRAMMGWDGCSGIFKLCRTPPGLDELRCVWDSPDVWSLYFCFNCSFFPFAFLISSILSAYFL